MSYVNWYVLSNLAVMLLITGVLVLLVALAHPFRWYWLLAIGFVLFWLVSLVVERRPLGTYILRRFFRE